MFPGVDIPFMHTLGFIDPAVAMTLTRAGSGGPGYSTPVFSLTETVFGGTELSGQAQGLSTGFGFVSQPTI